MAAFYHDSSRKSVFAERASGFGPIGPEKCQVDLLEWSPGMNLSTSQTADVAKLWARLPLLTRLSGDTITSQPLIQTNAQALFFRAQPRVQIVYGRLSVSLRY